MEDPRGPAADCESKNLLTYPKTFKGRTRSCETGKKKARIPPWRGVGSPRKRPTTAASAFEKSTVSTNRKCSGGEEERRGVEPPEFSRGESGS